jgi:hypothetical protein
VNFVEIQTVDDALRFMHFFGTGLDKCNETNPTIEHRLTLEQFSKVIFNLIPMPVDDRLILLATKDNLPVGFIVNFRTYKPYSGRKLITCYMAYATNDCSRIMTGLLNYGVQWARERGYDEIQCQTYRKSGAAFRLFEKRWGFKHVANVFSRALKTNE